jgi:hypothetical protein
MKLIYVTNPPQYCTFFAHLYLCVSKYGLLFEKYPTSSLKIVPPVGMMRIVNLCSWSQIKVVSLKQ